MAQIGDILGIAQAIDATTDRILGIRRDWRKAAATYLRLVASCLGEIGASLSRGERPERQCRKLSTYARRMPKTVVRILGEREAEVLRRALQQAHHARSDFMRSTASGGSGDPALMAVIEQVAGELEASADVIEAD